VWEIYGGGCFENVYLRTPDRGKLTVMDFVRMGMRGAQPRFAKWDGENRDRFGGIMYPAKELDLNAHPDARLIAAAPEMLAALKMALGAFERNDCIDWSELQVVIAKAEGDVALNDSRKHGE